MTIDRAALSQRLHRRVDALFQLDARGRMLAINQWDAGAPPRFFMMRTPFGAICRWRADVPDGVAARLEALAAHEPALDLHVTMPTGAARAAAPPGDAAFALPAAYGQYLAALGEQGRVEKIWAGPAYMLLEPTALVRAGPARALILTEATMAVLRGRFDDWIADVPHRQPFVAVVRDDLAVAVCASVRISDAAHCAGVETHAAHRRQGYAAHAVSAWARAVTSRGAAPCYSTSWDNLGSQGVARSLAFSLVGVDFHLT